MAKFAFGSVLVDKVAKTKILYLGRSRRYEPYFHAVPATSTNSMFVEYLLEDEMYDYMGKLPIRKFQGTLYCRDKKGILYTPRGRAPFRKEIYDLFD